MRTVRPNNRLQRTAQDSEDAPSLRERITDLREFAKPATLTGVTYKHTSLNQ